MKNELTGEEWLVLSEHLNLGWLAYAIWDVRGGLERNKEILNSAIKKVNDTASTIRSKKG